MVFPLRVRRYLNIETGPYLLHTLSLEQPLPISRAWSIIMPGHQLAVFYLAVLTISVSVNSSPQSFGTFRGPLPEKVPSNGQSARSTLRGSQSRHEGDPPQSSPDDHLGQPSAAVGGLQTQRPDGPLKQHSSNVFPVQPLTGGPGKHHSSDGSAIPHFTGGPPKHHSPNGLPKHDNPDAWPRHGHSPMDPEPTTPPSDEVKQAVPPNHHDDIPINININNGGRYICVYIL